MQEQAPNPAYPSLRTRASRVAVRSGHQGGRSAASESAAKGRAAALEIHCALAKEHYSWTQVTILSLDGCVGIPKFLLNKICPQIISWVVSGLELTGCHFVLI